MKTKKILCFIALFLYIIGTIGGIGCCLYSHAYMIAIAVAMLAVMAVPTVAKLCKFLTK